MVTTPLLDRRGRLIIKVCVGDLRQLPNQKHELVGSKEAMPFTEVVVLTPLPSSAYITAGIRLLMGFYPGIFCQD